MTDTFTISVRTGSWEYDDITETEVETLEPLFETPGYFATASRQAPSDVEVGGRTATEVTTELRIPWDKPLVPVDAIAVCTAIGPNTPARMLGRRVVVDGSSGDGSQRTHYPLAVTEVLT